jgi:cell division septal protein FtsQ
MLKLIKILFLFPGPKYSWKKVILVWTLSTLAVLGGAAASYLVYHYAKQGHLANDTTTIGAIVQTTSQTGLGIPPLQSGYLAQVLGLGADCPTKFNQFDLEEAKKRLQGTHFLKEVALKKVKPDLLFLHYTLRVPFSFFGDYTNTAIDQEGVLFPYAPFYPPRHLPRIYLGKKGGHNPWGEKIQQEHLALIHSLFATLGSGRIEQIDLSQVEAKSAGKRELIVRLKKGGILRLPPKNYLEALANYAVLKRTFLKESDTAIVDLRIPEVAYIYQQTEN